jgi:tetratricopeptide (TPR) repeat protein
MLALLVLGTTTRPAAAQGATHAEGHAGDGIRCSSSKPEIAIIACTNIIEDKREDEENRAIALRNRGFYFQQKGDPDRAITDYTTALKLSGLRSIRAKTFLNWGMLYFRKGDEVDALADYNEAVTLDSKLAVVGTSPISKYFQPDCVRQRTDVAMCRSRNCRDGVGRAIVGEGDSAKTAKTHFSLNTPRLKVVEHRLYPGWCATPSNRRKRYFEFALLHLAFQGLNVCAG